MGAALIPLHQQGICIMNYMDNCAPTKQQVRSNTEDVLLHVLCYCLNPQRILMLREQVSYLMGKISVKCGQTLLSLMAAASQFVPLGLLHMRCLQQWFIRNKVNPHKDSQINFVSGSRVCPIHEMVVFNARPPARGRVSSRETITTDASKPGWGAMWKNCPVQDSWQLAVHINLLEMEAVQQALKHFLPDLGRKHHCVAICETVPRWCTI